MFQGQCQTVWSHSCKYGRQNKAFALNTLVFQNVKTFALPPFTSSFACLLYSKLLSMTEETKYYIKPFVSVKEKSWK